MIVQCEKCQAKFKLDDSKVTEKGVKVRCSKCNDIFTVKKEERVVPEEAPAVQVEAPAEAGTPAQEPTAQQEPEEESAVEDSNSLPTFEGFGGLGDGFDTDESDKAAEEAPTFEPFEAEGFPSTEEHEEGEEALEEEGTAVKSSDESFGFAMDEPGLEFEAPESEVTDEETGTQMSSFGFDEEEEAPSFGMGGEEAPSPAIGEEATSEFGEFNLGEEESTSMALEVEEREPTPAKAEIDSELPPLDEVPPPPDEAEEMSTKRSAVGEKEAQKGAEKVGKKSNTMVLLLLFVVLAAGGLYYVVHSGMNINIGGIDLQEAIANLKPGAKKIETGRIDIKDLNGYYLRGQSGGLLFVIEGSVKNSFKQARSFIKVKGSLYNDKGEAVISKEAYSGNAFTKDELMASPRGKIEEGMGYKVGKGLTNSNIQPGKGIPFMIVFYDAPENLAEFDVDVMGSDDATDN